MYIFIEVFKNQIDTKLRLKHGLFNFMSIFKNSYFHRELFFIDKVYTKFYVFKI